MKIALLPGDARQEALGRLLTEAGEEVCPYVPGERADAWLFPLPTGDHPALGTLAPGSLALTALAAGYFYSADLEDRTVLAQSLWARMEEDTLTGLFLRTMRHRLDGAEAQEKPVLERAIRFGLAALEGREEPK